MTEPRPAGASFKSQPDTASSRQFESQPTETRGRYEHTLNARPDPPSGRSGAVFHPRSALRQRAVPDRSTATPERRSLTCKRTLAYVLGSVPAELYKALSDATRRAILDELVDRNGQTLFEICSRLIMKHGVSSTRQAISQHLSVLEDAGLVTTERRGRHKHHHLDTTPLEEIQRRWPPATRDRSTT